MLGPGGPCPHRHRDCAVGGGPTQLPLPSTPLPRPATSSLLDAGHAGWSPLSHSLCKHGRTPPTPLRVTQPGATCPFLPRVCRTTALPPGTRVHHRVDAPQASQLRPPPTSPIPHKHTPAHSALPSDNSYTHSKASAKRPFLLLLSQPRVPPKVAAPLISLLGTLEAGPKAQPAVPISAQAVGRASASMNGQSQNPAWRLPPTQKCQTGARLVWPAPSAMPSLRRPRAAQQVMQRGLWASAGGLGSSSAYRGGGR